jgi:hypothetical protein
MTGVLVDIGISTAYDYFFELARPNHDHFIQQPSITTMLNAAWAYWHLHEWYFWDHNPVATNTDLDNFRATLLDACPELGWLRDIAEAGKHFRLNRRKQHITVKAISTHQHGGYGDAAVGELAFGETSTTLVAELDDARHDIRGVMHKAFLYWLGMLLPHIVEIRLMPDSVGEMSKCMLEWCRTHLGVEADRKWKWVFIQSAAPPHYIQKIAFLEAVSSDAFRQWWTEKLLESG